MPRLAATLAVLAALAGCNRSPESSQEAKEPLRQYAMRGAVLRLDPQGHLATIKNEKIEGWMGPMTMDFPVKDNADFAKLHPGDTIRATVFVQGLEYWVGDVKPDNVRPENVRSDNAKPDNARPDNARPAGK